MLQTYIGTKPCAAKDSEVRRERYTVGDSQTAALIGVFTALGIQGDLLARMLRNEPTRAILAFVLALLGVAAGLIGTIISGKMKRWHWVAATPGILCLLGGAIVAISVGVTSAGVRDQPTLSISPVEIAPTSTTDPSPNSVLVRITASGSFLASRDRMLLRVTAFPDGLMTQTVWRQDREAPDGRWITTLIDLKFIGNDSAGSTSRG